MSRYIKLFDTHSQYAAFTASTEFIKPNVSACVAENEAHFNPLIPELYDYLYEDLSFGPKDTSKTAIGICVIPANVLPDRKARFMSLKGMTLTSPNVGGSNTEIYWGGAGSDIPTLTNYTDVITGESGTIIHGFAPNGYLPTPLGYTSTPHMPSPIGNFGLYSLGGATSDLDGKTNTNKILAVDNAASTAWQTAATITNADSTATIHPAAQCCWRFNPGSTNQGDWYLPSIGELGFIVPNLGNINTAINEVSGVQLANGSYWSSTEYDEDSAWYLTTGTGFVGGQDFKDGEKYVRAFLTL